MKKLQTYHSPNVHNVAVETHLRRLARNEGTDFLKENIQPVYDVFLTKVDALEQANKARIHGNDDIDYYDTILDNEIKNSSYDAKSYDMKSQKPPVYDILFPDGGYSPITQMNKMEEPAGAEALAKRFENLGAENPLYHYAADLRIHITNSEQAISILKLWTKALAMPRPKWRWPNQICGPNTGTITLRPAASLAKQKLKVFSPIVFDKIFCVFPFKRKK